MTSSIASRRQGARCLLCAAAQHQRAEIYNSTVVKDRRQCDTNAVQFIHARPRAVPICGIMGVRPRDTRADTRAARHHVTALWPLHRGSDNPRPALCDSQIDPSHDEQHVAVYVLPAVCLLSFLCPRKPSPALDPRRPGRFRMRDHGWWW